MHPVSAAYILTGLRVDEDTFGRLLHDVPEDTSYTLEDIEKTSVKLHFWLRELQNFPKCITGTTWKSDRSSRSKNVIHSAQDIRIFD